MLAAAGCTTKQIANRLGVAEATIKFHFANILTKVGVSSRTHAVTIALAHRWIRSPHAVQGTASQRHGQR